MQDQTNYEAPHTTVQPSAYFNDNERRRNRVTAFLCVYKVTRHYGGAEEGGWWYDSNEFTGAAFPFSAEQEFVWTEVDKDDFDHDDPTIDYDHENERFMRWEAVGLPIVTDEPTRVRLESARLHFVDIYGDPDAKPFRFSMRPRGDDYAFVYELQPGAYGDRRAPRYE